MGFGSFLKKALNPLNAVKSLHKVNKGFLGSGKKLLKGDFKGALKQGTGSALGLGAGLAGGPIGAALSQRFNKKLGLGGEMKPGGDSLIKQISNMTLDKGGNGGMSGLGSAMSGLGGDEPINTSGGLTTRQDLQGGRGRPSGGGLMDPAVLAQLGGEQGGPSFDKTTGEEFPEEDLAGAYNMNRLR